MAWSAPRGDDGADAGDGEHAHAQRAGHERGADEAPHRRRGRHRPHLGRGQSALHGLESGHERLATALVEHGIGGEHERVGELFSRRPGGSVAGGDGGGLLLAPPEQGAVVGPVDVVGGLGVETRRPQGRRCGRCPWNSRSTVTSCMARAGGSSARGSVTIPA